ncbi:MAG: hypothetical protein ACR2N9_10710 [Acidimicrobiia bacterium]
MKRIPLMLCVLAMIAAACSSDSTDTTATAGSDETPTTSQPTTTTTAATTTTEAPTTTAAPTTTTTAAPAGAVVAATPIVGQLQPYSAGGGELFPAGSVEAHWYQWDGLYVVLYRGFDAASGEPICAGNSINNGTTWVNISNAPHAETVEDICNGVPKLAEPPSGVSACGSLLYYLTEIPVDTTGALFGTLEIVADGAADGQTSQAPTDLATTPEFEPGLTAYELPPSNVDDLGSVSC